MQAFLFESGYLKYLEKRAIKEDFDYISQFFNKIKSFEEASLDPNLKSFMEELDLELESGEEGKLEAGASADTVKIMTVHAAKGLEFKHVFLANLVDRKFPTNERKDQIEIPAALAKDIEPEGDVHLQEERRLFYVAMTRAKIGLYFTSAKDYGGVNLKKPSIFLVEMGYGKDEKEETVKTVRIHNYKKSQPRLALPDHFSFTQLAAYEKCPRQYQYAHIWKIRPKGKAVFSYGKTMHNTLYESLLSGPKITLAKLKENYEKQWIDEWFNDQTEKDNYYKLGLKSLKLFLRDYTFRKPKILSLNGAPALEIGFNLKIGGYTINGKIDRVDEAAKGVEIIDYKTGTVKEKLRTEDKQQLLIYQIAAREVFGLEPEKLTYFYLENGKNASFIGSEKDIEKQKEKIISQIEEMQKSSFRAVPGWQCEWCDYKGICEFARK
jgi:DNA helicase-2/ATP-dependent DNA helicase PcrA